MFGKIDGAVMFGIAAGAAVQKPQVRSHLPASRQVAQKSSSHVITPASIPRAHVWRVSAHTA